MIKKDDLRLRGLFTAQEIYEGLGPVDAQTGKKFPHIRALKQGEKVLTCLEAQLLYSAFNHDNDLTDDLPKKAAIKKRFSQAMEPQMLNKRDGETGLLSETPVPGYPRRAFRFRDPSILCFTPEQASYLKTRLTDFVKAKDKEGKPLVTADSADAVAELLGCDSPDYKLKGLLNEWMEETRELKKEHVEDAKVEAEVKSP